MNKSTEAINANTGRQLFVDDYAVEQTEGIVRYWNTPTKLENPIIRPTADDGTRIGGCTVSTDGGLWWDPTIAKYRLWYEDNWAGNMRYAESEDGMKWSFPDLGKVLGTNRVFSEEEEQCNHSLDSWNVWPDYKSSSPYSNWRMFVTSPSLGVGSVVSLFKSADGRKFENLGVAGYPGDRSTMHYDCLLGKWVFSLRDSRAGMPRCRSILLMDEPVPGEKKFYVNSSRYKDEKLLFAEPWKELELDYGENCQLYNFDAVPYESLMLGVMEVLHNTPHDNSDGEELGLPKQTALRFAFSRDGRTYSPAPNEAICPCGWRSGKWDTGYLSPMGGICVIKDEKLWFYYSALRGDGEKRQEIVGKQPMFKQGTYSNGSIGAATMRRDGFCGMVADGNGRIVTKPLEFTGGHLFVNAECMFGEVSAEIIDADGKPFTGFAEADCHGLKYVDRTKAELVFKGGSLEALKANRPRIRFIMHCATLYSFWISPSKRGESKGFIAAGGPAYPCGLKDE